MELGIKEKVSADLKRLENSFSKLQSSGQATAEKFANIAVAVKGLTGSAKEAEGTIDKVRIASVRAIASLEGMEKGSASFKAIQEYATALASTLTTLKEKASGLSTTKIAPDEGFKKLENDILKTEIRMEELGVLMNKIMSKNPVETGQFTYLKQLQEEYYNLQRYLDILNAQYANSGRGIAEYTNSLIKCSVSAKEHEQRQRELTNAFERYFRPLDQAAAAEQRNAAAIARSNAARREAVQSLRQQSEALIRNKVALLEQQQAQIGRLYKNGKDTMSAGELERIRAAYADISRELMTLRSVMQNLSSYSTRDLFSIGSKKIDYSPFVRINSELIRAQRETAATAQRVQQDLVKAFRDANRSAGQMSSTLQDVKSLFLQGGLVYGAQSFLRSIIEIGGEMERQHIALQSILGDVQNANTMYGQIQELALRSPFTFSELNKDVKQLAAYGVEYENLYDTTKRLADMSAGLGVSFERIALAFGQVQARGWLDGKELRQIAYAGIPLLAKLSELYTQREGRKVTTSEIKKRISSREVGFEDVKQIFWDMTDVGGQFYNMQDVLSQTLLGRWLKLKDAWEIMLSDFASGKNIVGGTLSFMIDRVTDLVQAMHKLAPVIAASFSGVLLRRATMAMGGTMAAGFIANKGALASQYEQKALGGKKLTGYERTVLATRDKITNADIKTLVRQKAITATELKRLYVSGQITREMFKQNAAALGLDKNMKRATAAGSLFWGSMKKGAVGLYTMMGGWVGLLVTAATTALAALGANWAEWKSRMGQTADELKDRYNSIGDFLKTNDTGRALRSGDLKEIDSLIEEYAEKIKEIAPYDFSNILMTAKEKGSHEERLKYLESELRLIREANAEAAKRLNISSIYKNLGSAADDLAEKIAKFEEASYNLNMFKDDPSKLDYQNKNARTALEGLLENSVTFVKDKAVAMAAAIESAIGAKLTDPKLKPEERDRLQSEAKQMIESFITGAKLSESSANAFRMATYDALGIGGDFIKQEFASTLKDAINTTAPEIATMIQNGDKLDSASVAKLKEIMKGVRDKLPAEYRMFSNDLQSLLDSSKFMAIIRLAYVNDDNGNSDLKGTVYNRIVGPATGTDKTNRIKRYNKYSKYLDASGSWFTTTNNLKTAIDEAKNNWAAAKRSKAPNVADLKKEYDDLKAFAWDALLYDYDGEDKKSNKTKDSRSHKDDSELRTWRERVDAAKTFYQEYKKYRDVIGPDRAMKQVMDLYPEAVEDMDVNDYVGSFQKIIDNLGGEWFAKSPERKKFLTSIKKEIKEWNLTEVFKREAEEISAAFNEALERGVDQFDLYKTLLEKTGSRTFASQAFKDGAIWTDLTRGLAEEFKAKTGEDVDINATDAQAKHHLENIDNAYELWKKIVSLVKGDYKDALNAAADTLAETASIDDKILATTEKYTEQIKKAQSLGDSMVVARLKRQLQKDLDSLGLDKLKDTSDYQNFYAAIITLGEGKARAVADTIRKKLNEAFKSGAIDAKGYTDEIQKLNDKLNELDNSADTVWGNFGKGLTGLVDNLKSIGQQYQQGGANKMQEGQKLFNIAQDKGDAQGMSDATSMINAGKDMQAGGEALANGASEMSGTISMIDMIIHGINDMVQGMKDTFDEVREMYDALGYDTESSDWQDANTFMSSFSSASQSATNGWDSLKEGNVGGVISGVVGSWTSWVTGFAKGHDQKLQRQIELSERQVKELENMNKNISTELDNLLGGVYAWSASETEKDTLKDISDDYEKGYEYKRSVKNGVKSSFAGAGYGAIAGPVGAILGGVIGGIVGIGKKKKPYTSRYSGDTYEAVTKAQANPENAYLYQRASLLAQLDETRYQLDKEEKKKNTDKDAVADYKQQIIEMEEEIQNFASEYLNTIYSIDLKSWASELTDAIVDAWASGEDAADAYHDKVQEIMSDLAKNILSQSIMEKYMEAPLKKMTDKLNEKGYLDVEDLDDVADALYDGEAKAVATIEDLLDRLKAKGLDLSENNSSSSTSKSIKSITEETADLLASYLNSIRLDCSVTRTNVQAILESVKALPNISAIAQSQLTQLNQLVSLASSRNDKLDTMYDWMQKVTNGTKKLYVA